MILEALPFELSLARQLKMQRSDGVSLYWLGQAGFVVDSGGLRIVVDPYLSDSLAEKYRNSGFPHTRMAQAPLDPDELGPVDLVLCTHHHTDHMDAVSLKRLADRLPDLRFVVPAATLGIARERIGVGPERLIGVDAGDVVEPLEGLRIEVLRASHETLEQDEQGRFKFLGYGMTTGGRRIFHSGDTIPFDGQVAEIRAFMPELVLFPVNGRSEALKAAGFAGNLTLPEAVDLAEKVGADAMIAHHYGMFAFNTEAPERIDAAAAQAAIAVRRACFQVEFRLVVE